MDFQDWLLKEERLSISTAKKYVGALAGSLTQWGIDNNITSTSIAQIRNPSEFSILSGLIKKTDIFFERNTRGNGMYNATLERYSKYLRHIATDSENTGPFSKELVSIQQTEDAAIYFEPNDQVDARHRVLKEVVRRQGQPKFRKSLITAYEGRCAVSQCSLLVILDAAHVTPYLGPKTNLVSNGILLRTDLHTLWDLGLIAVNPNTMQISISLALGDPNYNKLNNLPVFQPVSLSNRISKQALEKQWDLYLSHSSIAVK